jgi:predicted RNase H-like nuclease
MGVDGCRAGWFYAGLSEDTVWTIGLATTVSALLQGVPAAKLILIDMPIGLRESGREARCCDIAARKVLGRPRAASVFPVPVRPALQGKVYQEASAINRRLTGRGMTRQAWGIVSRLRELDRLMRHAGHAGHARAAVREAHPEVCFWALNGGHAMQHNKKTPEGQLEREAVLTRYVPFTPEVLADAGARYRRAQLGWDDMLDALVLAVTARHGLGALHTLPVKPEVDAVGLPMEIVYAKA